MSHIQHVPGCQGRNPVCSGCATEAAERDNEQYREGRARQREAERGSGMTAWEILRATRKRWHSGEYQVNLEWPHYDQTCLFSPAEKKILKGAHLYPLPAYVVVWLHEPPPPNDVIRERRRANLVKDLQALVTEQPDELRKILMMALVVRDGDPDGGPDLSAPAPVAGDDERLAV